MAIGSGNAGGRFQYKSRRMICGVTFQSWYVVEKLQIENISRDFRIQLFN